MTDIIGAQVDLIVGIKEASDLPKEYENIYAIYNMNFIGGDNIKVASFSGMSNRPQFNHEQVHTFHITNDIAKHFQNEQLVINLFGFMPESEWRNKYEQARQALSAAQQYSIIPKQLPDEAESQPTDQDEAPESPPTPEEEPIKAIAPEPSETLTSVAPAESSIPRQNTLNEAIKQAKPVETTDKSCTCIIQ